MHHGTRDLARERRAAAGGAARGGVGSRRTGRVSRWPGATRSGLTGRPSPATTWTWWSPRRCGDAEATLEAAGFDVDHPPEDWLFKARAGDAFVDVLHRVNGVAVRQELLDCAERHEVLAIGMPVLSPTTVLVQKLRALNEHHCDFAALLPAVRAVRERLDWERIGAQTADNDFAVAFLVLAERLGLTA